MQWNAEFQKPLPQSQPACAGVCWKMASLSCPHESKSESVLYGVGSNPQHFQCQPPSKLSETPASSAVPRNSSTATCQLGLSLRSDKLQFLACVGDAVQVVPRLPFFFGALPEPGPRPRPRPRSGAVQVRTMWRRAVQTSQFPSVKGDVPLPPTSLFAWFRGG